MSVPLVQIERLRKDFRAGTSFFNRDRQKLRAVDGVSLSIQAGERFGIVGESGSGKSTLARCVLKLIAPSGGRIVFDGNPIFDSDRNISLSHNEMMKLRRDMQIIFQDPDACLDPRMSAAAIVAEGILKHRVAPRREAFASAADCLELCGISREMADRRPSEFSGGQKQRIGIARALAVKPRFIIADEPLSALDVSVQAQILNLMNALRKQFNLTFLFISHDLQTVEYFCDRIAVLYLGTLMETGFSSDVMNQPLHPYTQALCSSVPHCKPGERRVRIKLNGEIPSPINAPSGCKFHPRCPHGVPRCAAEPPVPENAGAGREVACHRWRELALNTADGNAGFGI
ncbi:MAG: dipeptide ABC transporter ATP-binding protein [Treponemataceae bacterium]|nr:MAG: dipeptide ABC transporter ATP-binding protein [Treponemataceae bacterium]